MTNYSFVVYFYLVDGVNFRETSEGSNNVGFHHEVGFRQVSDRLVHQGISIFNVKLSQQPVCRRITGQEDGVRLRWFLLQLRRMKGNQLLRGSSYLKCTEYYKHNPLHPIQSDCSSFVKKNPCFCVYTIYTDYI